MTQKYVLDEAGNPLPVEDVVIWKALETHWEIVLMCRAEEAATKNGAR